MMLMLMPDDDNINPINFNSIPSVTPSTQLLAITPTTSIKMCVYVKWLKWFLLFSDFNFLFSMEGINEI